MKRFLVPFLALMAFAGAARADLEFTVTTDKTGARPIALVPFAGNQGLPLDVAQVVENDLLRSGEFRTLARGDMFEKPSEPGQVRYPTWRTLNMDNIVIGSMRREPGSDRVIVRFYLLDALRGEQVQAFEMPPVAPEQLRGIAHNIADLIYEKLTGVPGIFSTMIAYVASNGIGPQRTYALYVADADGENPRQIATSREPLMSPSWSPDRKQLAYVGYERGKQSIYLHPLATGKVKKLVSEKGINGSPVWSPDGRYIAVTLSFEINPDIYVIDTQTNTRRRVTDHYGIDTEVSWFPDGQNLVFTSDRGGQPQIYKVSINGGDPERLTFEGRQNLDASVSPDGKSMAFVNVDGGQRIAIMDMATRRMSIVSSGNLDESPSFAPNGAVIIYARQTSRGAELATVSTNGRVRQELRQPGDVREPAWSPLLK